MSDLRSPLAVAIVLALAACSSRGSIAPSPSPGTPTASPAPPASDGDLAVDHATGATDLILRVETGGGFVPIGFIATQAPWFSLYGDGTLIARDDTAPWPEPGPDGLMRQPPLFEARLSEDEVQALLRFALGEGGLGIARPRYDAVGVADAPSTFFTVRAGGVERTVEVNALGIDTAGGPDTAIRDAFSGLEARLRAIAGGLSATAEPYVPQHWRGVLLQAEAGGARVALAWPWPDLTPADFTQADPNGARFASRALTVEDVAALDLGDLAGGIQNVALVGPDGQAGFSLALRPLFPDETG